MLFFIFHSNTREKSSVIMDNAVSIITIPERRIILFAKLFRYNRELFTNKFRKFSCYFKIILLYFLKVSEII